MAFKPSMSRILSSPTVYKVEANKLFGIDATTSDDNVSLSRACGTSYFNVENGNGESTPGMCNFIRTGYGEIGKRRGAKHVQALSNTVSIEKVVSIDNLIVLCTVESDHGSVHTNFWYAIHFLVYQNGRYDDYQINLGSADAFNVPFGFVWATTENVVVFADGGVIFAKTKDIINGELSAVVKISTSGVQFYESDTASFGETKHDVIAWEDAKIKTPTVYIGGSAKGGNGKSYESANLLNPWVCEMFQGDGTSTDFSLSFEPDPDYVPKSRVRDADGGWEGENSIGNIDGNIFKFTTAPGVPVITGEDNVMIVYRRKNWDMSQIANCNIYCNYGVGGYKDRLFVSGNEEYPNYVWYSGMDDYTYFADNAYLTFSDGSCEVKALAGQDMSLAVITNDKCYLVGGTVNDTENYEYDPDAMFLVSHVFESAKPAGYQNPLVFNNEIVYMSQFGLAAITPSNVMDERYVQIRSDRASAHLLNEDLKNLQCCVCGDFFVISNGTGRVYLLDGVQFQSTESRPFSYRQYETFIWELTAKYVWDIEGELHFINGNDIYRLPFGVGGEDEDYTDILSDGNYPVKCYWETPNIYGNDFYNKKSFSKLGILLRKIIGSDKFEINTTVRVWAKRNNDPWKLVKDYDAEQSVFRYGYLNYALFTYHNRGKKYSITKKIKFKKTYNLKLRFENDVPGMPLYLQAFSLEYTR